VIVHDGWNRDQGDGAGPVACDITAFAVGAHAHRLGDTPRFLYSYDETAQGDLVLPRGPYWLLTDLVDSAGSTLRVDDERVTGDRHEFVCSTRLRSAQADAVKHVVSEDTSVLIAPPGSGKTVIACAAIASRATSTLILVDR
jgi:hypothetical protein